MTLRLAGLVMLCVSCSSSYSLVPVEPSQRHGSVHECVLGVGPVTDEIGVDYGFDLRERLASGPCDRVLSVSDTGDDRADIIISGDVDFDVGRKGIPGESVLGIGALTVGGLAAIAGTIVLVIPRDGETSSRREARERVATYFIAAGAPVAAIGLTYLLVEGLATRPVRATGRVTARLRLSRGGRTIDEWSVEDRIDVFVHHPLSRPESRSSVPAFGGIYLEALARVFDDAAGRIALAIHEGALASPRVVARRASAPD